MYCLLIRRIRDGKTVQAHGLLYDTRAQLDRANDGWRRGYFGPAIFTKLQAIKEELHDEPTHE